MKTSFYSIHYNKPEFIKLQYKLICKYCKDEFRYIVVNNGKDDENVNDISLFCRENNIEEILTFQDRIPNTQDHSRATKYIYDEHISKDTSDFRVVIDHDIFPFGEFSISRVMQGYDIGGIKLGYEPFFISSFIIIFAKGVNLSNIPINIYAHQDATIWTYGIKNKYNVKWLNHTTQGNREIYYIFRNIPSIIDQYKICNDKNITFQIIENNLLHYWQGSEWNNRNKEFHKKKFEFINYVIENVVPERLVLDKTVYYNEAIMDEWTRPKLYPLNKINEDEYKN